MSDSSDPREALAKVISEALAKMIEDARTWKRLMEDGYMSVGSNSSPDEIADAVLAWMQEQGYVKLNPAPDTPVPPDDELLRIYSTADGDSSYDGWAALWKAGYVAAHDTPTEAPLT